METLKRFHEGAKRCLHRQLGLFGVKCVFDPLGLNVSIGSVEGRDSTCFKPIGGCGAFYGYAPILRKQ